MNNTKFMVKVVRGTRAAEYVQRIDRSPIQTTFKRNLALVMGKIDRRGRRQLSGEFPVHPGTRTRPGYRVAPPRDHRVSARLLFRQSFATTPGWSANQKLLVRDCLERSTSWPIPA